MKCPYCNSELRTFMLEQPVVWYCPNRCAPMLPPKIWRDLITGKKAQRQLRTVKDHCVKKVKAKEREIANYLNGISVRDTEIETLHKQLQEAQGALEDIIYFFDVVCQKDEMYFYDLIDNNIKKYREIAFITKHEE